MKGMEAYRPKGEVFFLTGRLDWLSPLQLGKLLTIKLVLSTSAASQMSDCEVAGVEFLVQLMNGVQS
jgi:hypothetical protein